MSMTSNISAKVIYTDYAERTYKIPFNGEYSAAGMSAVKTAIRNFNTAIQNNDPAVVQTFISENGAPIARISETALVTTQEDVIYSV